MDLAWEQITPTLTAATDAKQLFTAEVAEFFILHRDARGKVLEDLGMLQTLNGIDSAAFEAEAMRLLRRAGAFDETAGGGGSPREYFQLFSCFKSLDEFEEQEARWLVPGWIPEGQITLLAADGGVGKTTLWCDILAALSSGRPCVLDSQELQREPVTVAFFTTEDSVRKKLRQKLRIAGADLTRIISPDFAADTEGVLRGLKFGTEGIASFVRHFRPALCVFDPVQGFVPPEINMGSRNAMRDCLAPLVSLGEETGTSFLVVCHSNKRKAAFGRDRIADSADLWDIARSVLMAGYTEDPEVRYLSQEKSNYAGLEETLLFTVGNDGLIERRGSTWKRDREFTQDAALAVSKPRRESCEEWILGQLEAKGRKMPVKMLEADAVSAGYSAATLRRAKDSLKTGAKILYRQEYDAEGHRSWVIEKCS